MIIEHRVPTQVLKVFEMVLNGFHKFKALNGLKFGHLVLNYITPEIEQF